MRKTKRGIAFTAVSLFASAALAGQNAQSLIDAGMDPNCAPFAEKVSASEGNFDSFNQFGCVGAFQFCPGTLEQYFKGKPSEFAKSPKAQVKAWASYMKVQWSLVKKNGLDISGTEVAYKGAKFIIDASSILMACQFGCGKYGKLAKFVLYRSCDHKSVKDGNGVSVCEYLKRGAGKVVTCFTTESSPDKPLSEPPVVCQPATAGLNEFRVGIKNYSLTFDHTMPAEDIKKVLNALGN